MPTRKQIKNMSPFDRAVYEEGAAERAARKRLRTQWLTGATEKEKTATLKIALNRLPGSKKYAWLQQAEENTPQAPKWAAWKTNKTPNAPAKQPKGAQFDLEAELEKELMEAGIPDTEAQGSINLESAVPDESVQASVNLEAELERELMESGMLDQEARPSSQTENLAASAEDRPDSCRELQPLATVREGHTSTTRKGKKRAIVNEQDDDGGAGKKQKRTPRSADIAHTGGSASPPVSCSPMPKIVIDLTEI